MWEAKKQQRRSRFWISVIAILLAVLNASLPVLADGIAIDGSFTDWAGKASHTDPGGADDEDTPSRADITEFRADSNGNGLYLLKAWDDTAWQGNQTTGAGITLRTASNAYYRIYTTAGGNPGSVLLSSLSIKSCTDSTCSSQSDVCSGSGCSGAQVGSGTSWADPFSGRASPDCWGTNCGTQDTAVELYIPWNLIGGAPGDGQFIFLQFGSYPAGPAQAPKDDTGNNGLACRNTGGTFQCYRSNPNSVTLSLFTASPARKAVGDGWPLTAVIAAIPGVLAWTSRPWFHRRLRLRVKARPGGAAH